jgi:cell division protein FtsB
MAWVPGLRGRIVKGRLLRVLVLLMLLAACNSGLKSERQQLLERVALLEGQMADLVVQNQSLVAERELLLRSAEGLLDEALALQAPAEQAPSLETTQEAQQLLLEQQVQLLTLRLSALQRRLAVLETAASQDEVNLEPSSQEAGEE